MFGSDSTGQFLLLENATPHLSLKELLFPPPFTGQNSLSISSLRRFPFDFYV
jgi:hypothetical protein